MVAFEGSRPMGREGRRHPQFDRNRIVEEGGFDDQVIDSTVKTGLVQLIGLLLMKSQVGVRMTGHQTVDHDLRRNAQREQREQETC